MRIKELEDFSWFPDWLRKYQMQHIGAIVSYFQLYKKIPTLISKSRDPNQPLMIIDLCSGSGIPAQYIHKNLSDINPKTLLTDKYPQKILQTCGISYAKNSVDVLNFMPNDANFYTMYNAFHHFDLENQRNIINKLVGSKSRFLIVEIVQPNIINFVLITIASTIGVLLTSLFIQPFDWKRVAFTYIIPINIITVLIDGWLSIINSKSVSYYQKNLISVSTQDKIQIGYTFQFPTYITTIQSCY